MQLPVTRLVALTALGSSRRPLLEANTLDHEKIPMTWRNH
jgi:hypothetical protein